MAFVVTEAMDIKSDLGCCRATVPDMVPGRSFIKDVIMPLDGSTGHSNQHGPVAAQPLDTKMDRGGSLHQRQLIDLGGKMGHGSHQRPHLEEDH